MINNAQQIFNDALAMPPVEKAALIEKLFQSFDKDHDRSFDQNWAAEAEARIDGFESGKISAKFFKDVLADINRE